MILINFVFYLFHLFYGLVIFQYFLNSIVDSFDDRILLIVIKTLFGKRFLYEK